MNWSKKLYRIRQSKSGEALFGDDVVVGLLSTPLVQLIEFAMVTRVNLGSILPTSSYDNASIKQKHFTIMKKVF